MKKVFAFIALSALLTFTASNLVFSQPAENDTADETTEAVNDTAMEEEMVTEEETTAALSDDSDSKDEPKTLTKEIKIKFVEGGPGFMASVLLCLIFGLAIAIERIIYLNLSVTNTDKLLRKVESALEEGGVEAAKEVCRNTRGPVASIFYQGLDRAEEGIDVVEKSVISYGSVQMGLMEKGLSWISLFIAIAPMLGFMGTVIGMISAFDKIEAAGDVNASLVAGGIKIALITTVSGLIVGIILQIFYNYLLSQIDSIVNKMEDASISLVDLLVKFNKKQ